MDAAVVLAHREEFLPGDFEYGKNQGLEDTRMGDDENVPLLSGEDGLKCGPDSFLHVEEVLSPRGAEPGKVVPPCLEIFRIPLHHLLHGAHLPLTEGDLLQLRNDG